MSKRHKPDQKQLFSSLAKDFHELVTNKQALRSSLELFLGNVVDEITLGIIFDTHRKYKTNAYDLEVDNCDEVYCDLDNFLQHKMKKTQNCVCPSCERAVAATRFAPHLETCMGLGRTNRSCNASRRVASNSKDRESSTYGGIASDDDEDDVDWGSGDRRKKKRDKNSRRSRGAKKIPESEPVEQVNVDVEGEEDDLTNLRDILHLQDHSNSTSPADSASSSGSIKKRDKIKLKKNMKRERSPNLME